MPRYKLTFAYNGARFCGFQAQRDPNSIQAKIETALHTLTKEKMRVMPSGRTDAGVHALAQVLHFDTDNAIEDKNFLFKLGSMLKPEILITDFIPCKKNFHARLSAKKKSYVYLIYNSPMPQPFLKDYSWHVKKPLDVAAMKKAAKPLIGRHDFSSFCASDSTANEKVREIFSIKISTKHPAPFLKIQGDKFITLEVCGSGFLKQMVRSLAGTLVTAGLGKITPSDVAAIVKAKDRRKAYQTAPAGGLFLKAVKY